ncbi:MAG: leucine-rich repeat domain-containing protein [Proteobacteria bacterium]|nr:leucine-rich repeat domain-containing protein [Pseudomonadota bacterium]
MMFAGPSPQYSVVFQGMSHSSLGYEKSCLLLNKAAILKNIKEEEDLYALASNAFELLEKTSDTKTKQQCIDEINAAIVISRINLNSLALDCSNAMLTRIPDFLFKHPELQKYWNNLLGIKLEKNFLTTLPPGFKILTSLIHINLSENQFTVFPRNLRFLKKLKMLHLGKNKLKEIPADICQLTELECIYLHSNELTIISSAIGRLKKVYELDLSCNKLSDLPQEVATMSKLRKLWLSSNQLKQLMIAIYKLKSLTVLDISYNKISALPYEIGQCAALGQINLEGNPLPFEIIQMGTPAKIEELKKLYSSPVPVAMQALPHDYKEPQAHAPHHDQKPQNPLPARSNTSKGKVSALVHQFNAVKLEHSHKEGKEISSAVEQSKPRFSKSRK